MYYLIILTTLDGDYPLIIRRSREAATSTIASLYRNGLPDDLRNLWKIPENVTLEFAHIRFNYKGIAFDFRAVPPKKTKEKCLKTDPQTSTSSSQTASPSKSSPQTKPQPAALPASGPKGDPNP